MKKSFIVLLFLFSVLIVRADEGKWLLSLLNKNIATMQDMGCKLSAEDIILQTTAMIVHYSKEQNLLHVYSISHEKKLQIILTGDSRMQFVTLFKWLVKHIFLRPN